MSKTITRWIFFWIYKIYSQRKETERRDDLMYYQMSKEGDKNKFCQEGEKPDIRFFCTGFTMNVEKENKKFNQIYLIEYVRIML